MRSHVTLTGNEHTTAELSSLPVITSATVRCEEQEDLPVDLSAMQGALHGPRTP